MKRKNPRPNSMERKNIEYSSSYKIENGEIKNLTSSINKSLVDKINNVEKKIICSAFLLSVSILTIIASIYSLIVFNIYIFISSLLISLLTGVLYYFINKKSFVVIEFVSNNVYDEIYENIKSAIKELVKCEYIWEIKQETQVLYPRVNAGAETNIKRNRIYFTYKSLPKYIKTKNIDKFFCLSLGLNDYYFLPNGILYFGFKKAFIDYKDINISVGESHFREEELNPTDAILLNYTWQYVNSNGTPDRRFSYNKKIPVYLYGKITIKSKTGLNICLMASNKQAVDNFSRKFSIALYWY